MKIIIKYFFIERYDLAIQLPSRCDLLSLVCTSHLVILDMQSSIVVLDMQSPIIWVTNLGHED